MHPFTSEPTVNHVKSQVVSNTAMAEGRVRPDARSAPTKALTCTAAVALMVAATRWGSYIGLSPLFLTDLLILGSLVDRLMGKVIYPGRPPPRVGYSPTTSTIVLAFLAYTVLRMLLSGSWTMTVIWLRDGAPYLYAALALISGDAVARATPDALQKTMKWLWAALICHLSWVCVVGPLTATSALAQSRPFLAGGVFYGKPDIDSALLGVLAGLLLRRLFMGQRKGWAIVGLLAVAYGASNFTNRAGFISLVLTCAASLGFSYAATGRSSLRRLALVAVVPTAALIAATLLPSTTVGARLIATVQPGDSSSAAAQNAAGTAEARRLTWSGVTNWTMSDQSRTLFGAGMGVDFLAESGTLKYLEGTDYKGVRSPHDYFIGTFARLGLIGLGLMVGIIASLMLRLVRFRRRIAEDELLTFAALVIIAFIPVASLGVVLEAPFGAVPFWWAAGLILALVPEGSTPALHAVESPDATTVA